MHLTTLWSRISSRLATSAATLLFLLGVGMFTAAASAQGVGSDALAKTAQTGVLVLSKDNPLVDPSSAGRAWVDGQATLSITDVAALAQAANSPFMPQESGTVYQSGANKPLWLHYRLRTEPGGETEWLFEIPVTLIDAVTFFQRDKTGAWVSQSAGDTIAVSSWPELGRYPRFYLDLPAGETRDFFLRIDHRSPVQTPVRLITDGEYHDRAESKALLLGMILGVFALLALTCLQQSWIYRDPNYAWYALYSVLVGLSIAAYSGIAALLLWPDSGWWSDASRGFFVLVGTAAACQVIHRVSLISASHPRVGQALLGLAAVGYGLSLVYLALPRQHGLALIGVYVPLAVATVLAASVLTVYRGDEVGKWLVAAHIPMALATVVNGLAFFNWLEATWFAQYAAVMAILIQLPLSLVALNIRSRDRHSAQIREQEGKTLDALTGLMTTEKFSLQVDLAVANSKLHQDFNTAVIYFDLSNYEHIKSVMGYAIAERSLLRSVNALQRAVSRQTATVSRIGVARFGLILARNATRARVSALAVSIIADGLAPKRYGDEKNTKEVTLLFHIAVVMLNEVLLEGAQLDDALDKTLNEMSPSTKRQLRFVQIEVNSVPPEIFDKTIPTIPTVSL